MFKVRWWLSSEDDPRWNCSGTDEVKSEVSTPPSVQNALHRLDREINEPRPVDLRLEFLKE